MFLSLLTAVLMHPVHETVSEMQWNEETNRLEVSLRLSTQDELWISREIQGKQESQKSAALRYLRKSFRLDPIKASKTTADEKKREVEPKAKYHWVGRQREGSHVWWYFEIEPVNHKKPEVIEQRMFFERNENYANRVLVLGDVRRKAFTLTIRNPKANLNQQADRQVEHASVKPK